MDAALEGARIGADAAKLERWTNICCIKAAINQSVSIQNKTIITHWNHHHTITNIRGNLGMTSVLLSV